MGEAMGLYPMTYLSSRMIEKQTCLKCGWVWLPRVDWLPAMCPKCKSRYWNVEKKVATSEPVA